MRADMEPCRRGITQQSMLGYSLTIRTSSTAQGCRWGGHKYSVFRDRERRWCVCVCVGGYLLHAHAPPLRGISDKRRLLGESRAVAVTAVYLQRSCFEPNCWCCRAEVSVSELLLPCRCTGSEGRGRTSWSGWWCSPSWTGSAGGRPDGALWVELPSSAATATSWPCSSPCWPGEGKGCKIRRGIKP